MGESMAKLRLKFVNEYTDHTGRIRRYFHRNGKQLGAAAWHQGAADQKTLARDAMLKMIKEQ
jgi:hypothetical protein